MNDILIIIKNNFVELSAVIFSIIYVILAAKKNIFCWYAAIVSVLLYFYICIDAKLYAESVLQVFYLLMAFYGYGVKVTIMITGANKAIKAGLGKKFYLIF